MHLLRHHKLKFCHAFALAFLLVPLFFGVQAQTADAVVTTPMTPKPEITFTSWTGPYMRSQMLGFVRPYEAENNTRVHAAHYNGGIDEIRDQARKRQCYLGCGGPDPG